MRIFLIPKCQVSPFSELKFILIFWKKLGPEKSSRNGRRIDSRNLMQKQAVPQAIACEKWLWRLRFCDVV